MREFICETVRQLGAKAQLKIMKFYESLVAQGLEVVAILLVLFEGGEICPQSL
jgi:hypothetical protein